jgi:serine/threonine protein kinase, bacterial
MSPQALGSRYLLDEPIGEGGMGVVWRGRDRETGAPYAIKVLRPEFARDPNAVARFVRERTALVTFRHPNVVTVHDTVMEGNRLALIMDFIPGGDLHEYRKRRGGKLSPVEAASLGAQICEGLAAAHAAGIVHRDLKPANVLLDGGHVWLADFGIARVAGQPTSTTTGNVMGTVQYMAPEAIAGQDITAACDVYAVGITLYELLAGDLPFGGHAAAIMHQHMTVAPTRLAGVPDRLWDLISGCLSKNPKDRPSASALARALRTSMPAWDPTAEPAGLAMARSGVSPLMAGPLMAGPMMAGPMMAGGPVTAGPHVEATTQSPVQPGAATPPPPGVVPPGVVPPVLPGPPAGRQPSSRMKRKYISLAAGVLVCAGLVLALILLDPFKSSTLAQVSTGPAGISRSTAPGTHPGGRATPRPGITALSTARPGSSPGAGATHTAHPGTSAPAKATAKPGTSPKTSTSPAASASATASPASSPTSTVPALQWECSATKVQAGTNPQQTEGCIAVSGSTIHIDGSLGPVPAGGTFEQLELVVLTPAGVNAGYISHVCTPTMCTFTTSVPEPSGIYRVRADLLVGGTDKFKGDLSPWITVG